MEKIFAKLLGVTLVAGIGLGPVLCLAQMFPQPAPNPSVGESLASGFKRGINVELRTESTSWNQPQKREVLARFETSGRKRPFSPVRI